MSGAIGRENTVSSAIKGVFYKLANAIGNASADLDELRGYPTGVNSRLINGGVVHVQDETIDIRGGSNAQNWATTTCTASLYDEHFVTDATLITNTATGGKVYVKPNLEGRGDAYHSQATGLDAEAVIVSEVPDGSAVTRQVIHNSSAASHAPFSTIISAGGNITTTSAGTITVPFLATNPGGAWGLEFIDSVVNSSIQFEDIAGSGITPAGNLTGAIKFMGEEVADDVFLRVQLLDAATGAPFGNAVDLDERVGVLLSHSEGWQNFCIPLEFFAIEGADIKGVELRVVGPSSDNTIHCYVDMLEFQDGYEINLPFRTLGSGGGGAVDLSPYLRADGTVPLTADWNAGSHRITSNILDANSYIEAAPGGDPADIGAIRLGYQDTIAFRNSTNTANSGFIQTANPSVEMLYLAGPAGSGMYISSTDVAVDGAQDLRLETGSEFYYETPPTYIAGQTVLMTDASGRIGKRDLDSAAFLNENDLTLDFVTTKGNTTTNAIDVGNLTCDDITSTGFRSDATSEMVWLTGRVMSLTTSLGEFDIRGTTNNSSIRYMGAGPGSAAGAAMTLYGPTAGTPNYIKFQGDSNVDSLIWNGVDTWNFQANNVVTTGYFESAAGGDAPSLGAVRLGYQDSIVFQNSTDTAHSGIIQSSLVGANEALNLIGPGGTGVRIEGSEVGIDGANDLRLDTGTTLIYEAPPAQAGEATSLMIDASGNVGTRELGSAAFQATTYFTLDQVTTAGNSTSNNISLTGKLEQTDGTKTVRLDVGDVYGELGVVTTTETANFYLRSNNADLRIAAQDSSGDALFDNRGGGSFSFRDIPAATGARTAIWEFLSNVGTSQLDFDTTNDANNTSGTWDFKGNDITTTGNVTITGAGEVQFDAGAYITAFSGGNMYINSGNDATDDMRLRINDVDWLRFNTTADTIEWLPDASSSTAYATMNLSTFDLTSLNLRTAGNATVEGNVYAGNGTLTTNGEFYMGASSALTPAIFWSLTGGNDYQDFVRTSNTYRWQIAGATELTLSASTLDLQTNDLRLGGNIDFDVNKAGVDWSLSQTPTSASGASTDSEVLDHYEEGTWTPVLTDLTNNATMGTGNDGTFTRIGRVVFFSCRVVVSSLGSVSGNVYISGLPFPHHSKANEDGGCYATTGNNLSSTAGYHITGEITNGQSRINLRRWDIAGGTTQLQASEVTSSGQLRLTGQYYTAT